MHLPKELQFCRGKGAASIPLLGDGYTGDHCFSDLLYKLHVLSILDEFRIHLSF